MLSILCCFLISSLYVASLYVWRGVPASRQHPDTVKARMSSSLLICGVAWIPARLMHRQLQHQAALSGQQGSLASLPALLGLQLNGPAAAVLLRPVVLTVMLFLGPLHHMAVRWWQQHKQQDKEEQGGNQGPPLLLFKVRDYLIAPVTEEWCFRACMVPLLWMEGFTTRTLVFLTPVFFGLCHLHHARELIKVYGPSVVVLQVVLLQLLYTTVFGWYATWVFVATGSIAAAMIVHALCNMLGLPPFRQMNRLSLLLCTVGMVLFGVGVYQTQPGLHSVYWQPAHMH